MYKVKAVERANNLTDCRHIRNLSAQFTKRDCVDGELASGSRNRKISKCLSISIHSVKYIEAFVTISLYLVLQLNMTGYLIDTLDYYKRQFSFISFTMDGEWYFYTIILIIAFNWSNLLSLISIMLKLRSGKDNISAKQRKFINFWLVPYFLFFNMLSMYFIKILFDIHFCEYVTRELDDGEIIKEHVMLRINDLSCK